MYDTLRCNHKKCLMLIVWVVWTFQSPITLDLSSKAEMMEDHSPGAMKDDDDDDDDDAEDKIDNQICDPERLKAFNVRDISFVPPRAFLMNVPRTKANFFLSSFFFFFFFFFFFTIFIILSLSSYRCLCVCLLTKTSIEWSQFHASPGKKSRPLSVSKHSFPDPIPMILFQLNHCNLRI